MNDAQTYRSPAPSEYEFTAEEDDLIRSTVTSMRTLAWLAFAWAAARVALAAVLVRATGRGDLVGTAIESVFTVAFGGLVFAAARPFERIVTSRGDDIAHLMFALGALRRLFRGQAAWLALTLVGAATLALIAIAATAT